MDGRIQSIMIADSIVADAAETEAARAALVASARLTGPATALAMLDEALRQIERIGPTLSGEVWESYAAVERTGKALA